MASAVDICNLALARLGDDATVATIDPPEGSAQASHCARFYPIARDSLLEMHPWKFARRRAELAMLAATPVAWQYAYAFPNAAVRIVSVLPVGASSDAETVPYDVETDDDGAVIVVTNEPAATVSYITQQVDVSRFSPLFIDALAWLLGAHLAGPLLKGKMGAEMAQMAHKHFLAVRGAAIVADTQQRRIRPDHQPAWIARR